MADNTLLNSGSGGNTLRTLEDGSSIHWPVGVVAYATTVGTPDVLTVPTAAALADNTANPTTLLTGACLMNFDGSTWDRVLGDSTDGLLVNLGTNNNVTVDSGTVTTVSTVTNLAQMGGVAISLNTGVRDTGTQRVTIATDDTVTVDLGANNDVTIDNSSIVKAEDAVHSTGDAGVMALSVRNDTLAALAGTDGDYAPLQVNASGALYVAVDGTVTVGSHAVTNAGTFAVQVDGDALTALQLIDDAVHSETDALSKGLLIALDDGTDAHFAQANASGHLKVDIATDTVGIGGGTQYAEDTAHNTGDTGTMALSVRNDTLAALAGTDGDYAPLQVNATGALYVSVDGTVTVGSHAVTNAGTFAVQVDGDALTALQLIDDPVFADDAAFTLTSSKVSMAGAIRDDALTTLTAVEGDAVPLRVGSTGALHVTGAGGGTQYAVNDALGATATGTLALASRDDVLTTLGPAEGDATELRVSATGSLWTKLDSNSTVVHREDDAFASLDEGIAAMVVRKDTLSSLVGANQDWSPMLTNADGALWTQPAPATTGGLSFFKSIDLDESEEAVKATAGQVYGIIAINLASSVRYLKIYNATVATVVVGTTVPDITIPLPTQGDTNGAGAVISWPMGVAFSTAITVAATTGVGDADAGAPGANEVVVTVLYK